MPSFYCVLFLSAFRETELGVGGSLSDNVNTHTVNDYPISPLHFLLSPTIGNELSSLPLHPLSVSCHFYLLLFGSLEGQSTLSALSWYVEASLSPLTAGKYQNVCPIKKTGLAFINGSENNKLHPTITVLGEVGSTGEEVGMRGGLMQCIQTNAYNIAG